jgi:NAD(P)-dependent dehydrogenase (short-subunit alcohol dehydrogenase family)
MFNLTGKVALITGGNGGLGLAFARGMVKSGAAVAIWGRNESKNTEAVEELLAMGGNVAAFQCDVLNEDNVASAFSATLEKFGKVDICIANAGGGGFRGLSHQVGSKVWRAAIDLNVTSVTNTFAPVTEHLLTRGEGGKLMVTSSAAALMGFANAAGYSTTKAAVIGLVKALAVELGRANIQVNAILPGFVETEMSLTTPKEFQDACLRRSALGRIGTFEDMEGIAVFLASNNSDYMTGQALVIDGGHTIFPM